MTFSSSATPLSDSSILHLNHILKDLHSSYFQLLWIVLWSSCFFVSFICWDSASDAIGPIHSIWIPLLGVITVASLQISEKYLLQSQQKDILNENRRESRSRSSSQSHSQSQWQITTRETEIIPFHHSK